jgi:DNA repair protein RecO (recombination protein O)
LLEWSAEGLLLAVRRLGEGDAIIEVLTAEHGRHAGVVKGGAGRRLGPVLQPGAQLQIEWRARLEEHIGTARVEPMRSRAAGIMAEGGRLAALTSATALLCAFLPEREAHPALYATTVGLCDALERAPDWARHYALWELGLLTELGFGLSLERCAATGATDDLTWVSPRSGRAVSRSAGAPYAHRLLPLPGFLCEGGDPDAAALRDALRLTGWFLEHRAAPAFGLEAAPPARARLVARFSR